MALRLRVVGARAAALGDATSKVFGVHGGSLGRALDNDWPLPDPERYLSGHHAHIDYRDGGYWLTDTSTNGTFVNDSQSPVSYQGAYALQSGDRLHLGEYEMVVTIDASNDFPPDESAIVAHDNLSVSRGVKRMTEQDLGADLDLDVLLGIDSSGVRPVVPVNAYGVAVDEAAIVPTKSSPRAPAPAPAPAPESAPEPAESSWNLSTRRIEPYRNPLSSSSSADNLPRLSSETTSPDSLTGIQALCRGAGIDPSTLPPAAHSQVLQLAGQILRETVIGLIEISQNRSELQNRFHIPQPAPSQGNPLRQGASVDETLRRLFDTRSRLLGPAEAVRQTFSEIKTHHQAMQTAMHTACMEFIARLNPEELQERFDRTLKRTGAQDAATNKTKYWDRYGELYQSLTHSPKDELPHLFIEEFAKAYEAKLAGLNTRKPRSPRNGA